MSKTYKTSQYASNYTETSTIISRRMLETGGVPQVGYNFKNKPSESYH